MADDGRLVQVSRRGPAAVITLDSPHNRNALSRALLAQLHAALLGAFREDGVRVVVLTGTGPAFCSGADLKEQRAGGPPPVVGLPDVLTAILEAPLPVIARVNGVARAGASGAARELFLTGAPFDGTRARDVGLLDRAATPDRLDATVDELVEQLALGAPGALAATKALLRDLPGDSVADDLRRMEQLSLERFGSVEAREGIAALLEKRSPSWAPDSALPSA